MTRQLVVALEARADIAEAVDGLRGISDRLALRFGIELETVFGNITDYPEMYPVVYKNFRRGLIRHFPYSVFYVVQGEAVVVMGVVHQSRHESTWKYRA